MAPIATPHRRSLSEVDSSDEEGPVNSSTSRSKRIRHDATHDSASTVRKPSTYAPHLTKNGLQSKKPRAQESQSKHQPGAIVRVKLKNFVTYTDVEFHPGPNLNMVIGPNGTGKSTLVCAICIGLGWGPQYLGRAKEVSEFVKHGCKEASIEIELAKDGRQFRRNVVIRCLIKKDGNKTIYSVNGENKSKKATVELARSLSIQIDNLCQFLPQDKVVEFAAMTPVELLRSTQRAVGDEDMIQTHESLSQRRKEQKGLRNKMSEDEAALTNLEGRQRLQEADVERMRQRAEIVKRVSYLEYTRPFPLYREAKYANDSMKEKVKVAESALQELRDELEPSLRAVTQKRVYKDQCVAACEPRRKEVSRLEERADKINRKYNDLIEQDKGLDAQIEAEKKGKSKHRNDMARYDHNIAQIKKQMEEPEPEVDSVRYNEQIREKKIAMREAEERINELKNQQIELNRQGREKNQNIVAAESGIEQLESQVGRQNNKLQALSRDTHRGWMWIQDHKNEFEREIYGPPIVECSVKDPKYVDLIEALFQRNTLLSFTVQTKNDFAKLSHILHDKLRLSEINIKTVTSSLDAFSSAVSTEEMRRFGFDSWALDHMQGPDAVLAMLCAELRLHETGIGLPDTSAQQFEMLQRSQITSWVTSKSLYKITRRREYGPSATSTSVRDVKPARVWTEQPVDLTAKREAEERIQALKEEVTAIKSRYDELTPEIASYRELCRKKKVEEETLSREKSDRQKAVGDFRALPNKLAQETLKRDGSQKAFEAIEKNVKDMDESKDELAMQRAQEALKYAETVEALQIAHNSVHEVVIMSIEAISDLEVLTERNASINNLLATKEKDVETLRKEGKDLRTKADATLKACKAALSNADRELDAFIRSQPKEQTVQDLENEIAGETARLELMHEGNGSSVIREYEMRQKKIDGLSAQLSELRSAKEELDSVITSLQEAWEPRLEALVAQISTAFSFNMRQINCAGEVGIWKDEDFDLWSIQIRVKFRDSEPMTVLDSHRQSGGERAVSTIFYLMSLQSLTRSPFRIVDEINQGMDPRNERLVHKRMVEIACGSSPPLASAAADHAEPPSPGMDSITQRAEPTASTALTHTAGSQYFLITPKLLHDLEYARGMQVLCIASGEYMPSDQTRVDFKACLQLMRGLKGLEVRSRPIAGAVEKRKGYAIGEGFDEDDDDDDNGDDGGMSEFEGRRLGIAAG